MWTQSTEHTANDLAVYAIERLATRQKTAGAQRATRVELRWSRPVMWDRDSTTTPLNGSRNLTTLRLIALDSRPAYGAENEQHAGNDEIR